MFSIFPSPSLQLPTLSLLPSLCRAPGTAKNVESSRTRFCFCNSHACNASDWHGLSSGDSGVGNQWRTMAGHNDHNELPNLEIQGVSYPSPIENIVPVVLDIVQILLCLAFRMGSILASSYAHPGCIGGTIATSRVCSSESPHKSRKIK
jgi:hypothetical protein